MEERIVENIKNWLRDQDTLTFNDRVNRLIELQGFPLLTWGDFPKRASDFWRESLNCYFQGYYRASIFGCAVSADQILRHEILRLFNNKEQTFKKIKSKTMGQILQYFNSNIKTNSFDNPLNQIIKKFEIINKIRNTLSVHPAYLGFLFRDNDYNIDSKIRDRLFIEDIYKIFEIYYQIKYPSHLFEKEMEKNLEKIEVDVENPEGKISKESMSAILKNDFKVKEIYYDPDQMIEIIERDLFKPLSFETIKIMSEIIRHLYGYDTGII